MKISNQIKIGSLIRSLLTIGQNDLTKNTIYEVTEFTTYSFKIINDCGKILKISIGSEADENWFELVAEKKEIDFLKFIKGY